MPRCRSRNGHKMGLSVTETPAFFFIETFCIFEALGNYLATLQLFSILLPPLGCGVCEMSKLWKEMEAARNPPMGLKGRKECRPGNGW